MTCFGCVLLQITQDFSRFLVGAVFAPDVVHLAEYVAIGVVFAVHVLYLSGPAALSKCLILTLNVAVVGSLSE